MFEFEALESFFVFLPAFMRLLLLLLTVLLIYNRKIVWNAFRQINKKTWLLLLLIVLLAFFLRFFWVPHRQIDFYDGFNWVSLSFSIEEHGVYRLCTFVSDQSCYEYSFHAWPPMYSTLLSMVFKVFGSSESVAFHFNAFLGTISVFLAFLLSYLWTKKEDIALIGAFAFSLLPVLLKFSGGVVLGISSIFFLILTLIFFEIFIKEKQKGLFLLFLVSLLCTIYIRPENIFLALLFLLFLWLRRGFGLFWNKENKGFFLISILYFLILLAPAVFLIYIGRNVLVYEGWTPTTVETINYFFSHSPTNLYFFINYQVNPHLFIFFGALGMIFTFIKERKMFLFFFLLFLFYFTLYSGFDVGVFDGSLVRYSLILYVPLLCFFVKGMSCFLTNAGEKFKKPATLIFIIVFIASLIPTTPYILKEEPQKITTDLLLASKNMVPENAYFVSSSSAIIRSTVKRNVVALTIFKNQEEYFKDKQLFLLKDIFWWKEDKYLPREFIYENYDLQPIETGTYKTHGNIYEVGVYRLIKK